MAVSGRILLNLDFLTLSFYSLYCILLLMLLLVQQGLWLQYWKDFTGGETDFLFPSSCSITQQMSCLLWSSERDGLPFPISAQLLQQPGAFICHCLPYSLCHWPLGATFWSLLLTLFQTQQKVCLGISFLNPQVLNASFLPLVCNVIAIGSFTSLLTGPASNLTVSSPVTPE